MAKALSVSRSNLYERLEEPKRERGAYARPVDEELLPYIIEWLTDNGSCFTARETLEFAREVGMISRFTPVRSLESNGMAEAFVKTLKRDYASCNGLPDAKTVIGMLSGWIEDYNEYAPHKGLEWLSPRQFRRKALSGGNFPGAACVPTAA